MATTNASNPVFGVKSQTEGKGTQSELISLLDNQNQYDMLAFPLNLGAGSDVQHWVTFYINLPQGSKTDATRLTGVQTASQQNAAALGRKNAAVSGGQIVGASTTKAVGGALSTGTWQGGVVSGGAGAAAGGIANQIETLPKLDRIKTAISIYMPDTVVADYSHNYDETSLTQAIGKYGSQAALAAGSAQGGLSLLTKASNYVFGTNIDTSSYTSGPTKGEALGQITEATGQFGPGITDFALKAQGASINPQVELMFKGTRNRDFIFQFTFVPKTAAEAEEIRRIIHTFKYFAAPEYNGDQNGRYFINPAQFDIAFFFNGKENTNLNKISTCVLENVMVNYSPQQFITFNDGMPAQIVMQLRFKEADIMYRQLIGKFGY